VTNDEAIRQFVAAMQSRDLALADGKQPIADGRWHRCAAINKSNNNDDGSYWLRLDGPSPVGQYRNWTDGRDPDTWHGSLGRPLTEAERAELDRWMAQRRAEQEKKAAELADEARQLAQRVWGKADDASASQHQRSHRVLRSCGV
jgi:hypothetical protein